MEEKFIVSANINPLSSSSLVLFFVDKIFLSFIDIQSGNSYPLTPYSNLIVHVDRCNRETRK